MTSKMTLEEYNLHRESLESLQEISQVNVQGNIYEEYLENLYDKFYGKFSEISQDESVDYPVQIRGDSPLRIHEA